MKNLRRDEIKPKISHPRRPNESPVEASIRELKKKWYRIKQKTNAPDRVSDFGIKYALEIGNVTHNTSRYSYRRTLLEIITGLTPDITEYLDFGFWDWVTYKSEGGTAPAELGKWLGVSHQVGQLMTYWVIPISGIPISVGTVQRLPLLEQQTDVWKEKLKLFEKAITPKMETASANILDKSHNRGTLLSLENESEEFKEEFGRDIDNEKILHYEQQYDQIGTYTKMEVALRCGYESKLIRAQVKKRVLDPEGHLVVKQHNNHLMETSQYKVEYEDGAIEVITYNIIEENILTEVDDEGQQHMLMGEIIDHRIKDNAVPMSEGTYKTLTGEIRKLKQQKAGRYKFN